MAGYRRWRQLVEVGQGNRPRRRAVADGDSWSKSAKDAAFDGMARNGGGPRMKLDIDGRGDAEQESSFARGFGGHEHGERRRRG